MSRFLLLLIASASLAQITAPLVGYFRDRAGNLRPLHGVAGAFVPGEPIDTGVISASFSSAAGFVKKQDSVVVYRGGQPAGAFEAPAGAAAFGFDVKGEPAWIRFDGGECRVWRNDRPETGDCPDPEPVPDLDLPEPAQSVERMADGWLLVHTESALLAIRTGSEMRVWRVPEVLP